MNSHVRKGLAIAALAGAILVPVAAQAADFPATAPVIQHYVPVAAVFNWTAGYAGVYAGAALADRRATTTEPATAAGVPYNLPGNPYSYNLNTGWLAGVQFGFNYQPQGRHIVVGLEGEGGYFHIARTITDPNVQPIQDGVEQNRFGEYYGVLALRLGVAFDRVLLYGKGGGAVIVKRFDWNDNCTVAPCGPLALNLSRDRTYLTWAAGGGVEFAINNFWTVKAEYLYIATRETFTVSGVGGIDFILRSATHTDPGLHTVKIGVNYLFK